MSPSRPPVPLGVRPVPELLRINDRELLLKITEVHTRLDDDSDLGVYLTGFTPASDDDLADYTEPAHGEYARVTLDGLWTTPARDEAGVYSTQTEYVEFQPPTAGGDQVVAGWFLVHDGEVHYAAPLDEEFTLTIGGAPLRLRIVLSEYSGHTHAERVCT